MSEVLLIGEALCDRTLRVLDTQRLQDVLGDNAVVSVEAYVVFDEEERFCGLVIAREAALFPSRIFADLITRKQPIPLSSKAPLQIAIDFFLAEKLDYAVVMDRLQTYAGVISRYSLFAKLLTQERELRADRTLLIERLEGELVHHKIATTVFDATSEGIVVTGEDHKILHVNAAFYKTTGFTSQEVVGKTPRILSSGRQDKAFYEKMWRSIQAEGVWQGEIWNRRKNGEIYPEWLTINSVVDVNGAVTNYVGVFSDISLHKELQRSLHKLAYYDHLTSLPNRTLFRDRLDHAIAMTKRDGACFALLFIDLDNFKHINDALGHRIGDEVLTEIGRRLQSGLRETDTASRLGGDEFAALITNYKSEDVLAKVVESLFDQLNGHVIIEGYEVFVTVSIGVARFPQDATNAEILLSNADIAMYRAKNAGREQICYYTADMNERIAERLRIENALRHSHENGAFWLAWQLQVDLRTNKITGAEVLMRCSSPELGDIGPGTFIPIAEESGLIVILGEWVLRQAVQEAQQSLASLFPPGLRIAVNMSLLQLSQSTIERIRAMADILTTSGFILEIEITESALMKEPSHSTPFLQKLFDHGVEIAVDDFGTGFSNLSRLKDMPIHRIKIDQSFIRDFTSHNESAMQIVKAIIAMGHALNLKVIAEGVETQEQARLLTDMGCDEAQGYWYSRPTKVTDLEPQLDHARLNMGEGGNSASHRQ